MTTPSEEKLRVGVLGCGPIAQAGHFESCAKAKNAELYALCDSADDLRERMAAVWEPRKAYASYQDMLDDPKVEAVIIAAADAFHVDLSLQALRAGKHVLCEKPLAVTVRDARELADAARAGDRVFQVAHMKRFDGGIQAAKDFVDREIGERVAYKGWYCDHSHRYTLTDAVQPKILQSAQKRRPAVDPKTDLEQYYLLAHGSHLVDTALFLMGKLESVEAKFLHRGGVHCWFVDVVFEDGALGHLDLSIGVRMDWHEGFNLYGRNGSVLAKTYNPWLFKSSDVDIFREADVAWTRPLAPDGHFYRRQLEAFADTIRNNAPMTAATADDGAHIVAALAAIRESTRTGKRVGVADAAGSV